MDLFEKQAQLQSLFQTSPVDAAYAQGTSTGRRIAGKYQDLDVALLLLQRVNASEFFDYQVYFVSELSKTLEIEGLDVVILNQASLLQRAQIIRSWSLLYQRDQKSRVHFEARAVMDYLEFKKYDDVQSKALAERTRGERFAIDAAYVRARIARLREYTTLLDDLKPIEHRSEEHTSELQSQSNLVCRLLLEKKKKQNEKTRDHQSKNIDQRRRTHYQLYKCRYHNRT